MNLPEALVVLILAVLQGIAEFLPISSSGHLVVIGRMLGSDGGTALNVVLHFGTLISIVIFYRRRILELLGSDRWVVPLLIIGTVPAAVLGLWIKKGTLFGKSYAWVTDDPLLAGFMMVVTGCLLLLLQRIREGVLEYQKMGFMRAFLIGVAQAIALLPGISRSGSTIVAASSLGLTRQSAATWSFLLAIPAIGGAMLLEAIDLVRGEVTVTTPVPLLVMGAAVSAVVGLFSLRILVRLLDRGRLHWFAYWLIPFGMAVAVWQMWLIAEAGPMTRPLQ